MEEVEVKKICCNCKAFSDLYKQVGTCSISKVTLVDYEDNISVPQLRYRYQAACPLFHVRIDIVDEDDE